MERVLSQEDIVRMWGGLTRTPSEAAFQSVIQRVPSLNTLLGNQSQGGNQNDQQLSVEQQQQQHIERVQSMDMLRKFLGSSGDLSQFLSTNNLHTMNQQAANQAAQAAVQQAQLLQQQQKMQQQNAVQLGNLAQAVAFQQQNSVQQKAGVNVAVPNAIVGGYMGSRQGEQQTLVDSNINQKLDTANAFNSMDKLRSSSTGNTPHHTTTSEHQVTSNNGVGINLPHESQDSPQKTANLQFDGDSVQEMRRMRRMLSNRESARRSRRRKQDHLSTLETKMNGVNCENVTLRKQLQSLERKNKELIREKERMKAEIERLKKMNLELLDIEPISKNEGEVNKMKIQNNKYVNVDGVGSVGLDANQKRSSVDGKLEQSVKRQRGSDGKPASSGKTDTKAVDPTREKV